MRCTSTRDLFRDTEVMKKFTKFTWSQMSELNPGQLGLRASVLTIGLCCSNFQKLMKKSPLRFHSSYPLAPGLSFCMLHSRGDNSCSVISFGGLSGSISFKQFGKLLTILVKSSTQQVLHCLLLPFAPITSSLFL